MLNKPADIFRYLKESKCTNPIKSAGHSDRDILVKIDASYDINWNIPPDSEN